MRVVVGKRAYVDRCLLADDVRIKSDARLRSSLRVSARGPRNPAESAALDEGVPVLGPLLSPQAAVAG